MRSIRGILDRYEKASGQQINLQKSSMVFSRNTPLGSREELAAILGVKIDSSYEKYLGLPYVVGRKKKDLFQSLRDRVRSRVDGWKEKLLSQAGKEILIKAILQATPSYIIEARTRWRIGDGRTVKVRGDKWLPRPHTFKPILLAFGSSPQLCVADLIDLETMTWNPSLLDTLFWKEDAKIINDIPISRSSTPDILIWHYNKNGCFSIKSAYHVTCCLLTEDNSSNSDHGDTGKNRTTIWNARIPNKIKVFLWRACKEAIPTITNIIRRKCHIEASCGTCGAPSEDSKHVFLQCSHARQSWALANFPWKIINRWGGGLVEWIGNVRKSLEHSDFNLFAVICWMLWNRRNKLVMEKRKESPLDTILSAKSFLHYFDSYIIQPKKAG
ncbi:UNVERIFIED_CONTAM: hypothetical protein Slati_0524300 [Sesamum latifolium]|uniref:Reverse transcriptase zinc-binding domain-containing protein n=1 Tax=Sesamum latifolium TaxID=2727402 RepID=A0AAW2Y0B7_9LAMI